MTPASPAARQRAAARVFDHQHVWRLEPDAFTAATGLLVAELSGQRLDVVIGVHRGGTPLAIAVATELGRPAVTVRARHNRDDGLYQPAIGTVGVDLGDVAALPPGLRIVVCDDVCGSGATLDAVTAALSDAIHPAAVTTAVLCRNAGATHVPDLWIWDVRDWVVFPWEPPPDGSTLPLPPPNATHRIGS